MRRKRAFTIIELLVTLAVIAIIGVVVSLGLNTNRHKADVKATAQKVAALLQEARNRAVSQDQNTSWGVYFVKAVSGSSGTSSFSTYALFSSSTSNIIEQYSLPSDVIYDSCSFSNGGQGFCTFLSGNTQTITFSPITGATTASTSIIFDSVGAVTPGVSTAGSFVRQSTGKIFFDDFSGGLGNWTKDSGNWTVASNQLTITPTSSSQIHVTGSNYTDGVIDVTLQATAKAGNAGPIARADSGSNNYGIAILNFASNGHRVQKTVGGTVTTVKNVADTLATGTTYYVRGTITSGSPSTTFNTWVNGANAVSTADASITSPGYIGLEAQSGNTWTFDDFAYYTSTIVTVTSSNGGPTNWYWAVLSNSGSNFNSSCINGNGTEDISLYPGQIPVDYDLGGGSIGIWTGGVGTCNPPANATYAFADIFGGDVFFYTPSSTVATSTVYDASSSVTIGNGGAISYQ